MIDDLKPYPVMKDSGVPWLGEVPQHWEIERAKWLFRKMDRPVQESDEVVTCFRDGVVTLRKNRRVRGFTESMKEIGYQGIRHGDLVIHAMDAFAGAIGVSDSDGKGTPVYSVCEPIPGVDAHYYAYTVREMARSQWIQALAKGIRERSTDFRFDDFGSQLVPLPPVPEQATIVCFLDYMDRRIRRYIRAKQTLIKLLEEQKQAIIHRAVTRGLNPNVRLKPSGVEWLGDVPEHWGLPPLKHACSLLRDGTHLPPPRQADGFPLLSVRNIVSGRLVRREDDSFISEVHFKELCRSFTPTRDDVLLAIVGATLGKVAIVPEMDPFQIQRSLALLRPRENLLDSRFLQAFVEGPAFQRALWTTVAFSAQPGIYLNALGAFRIPVPTLAEQQAIVERLEGSTAAATQAIDRASREISLLRKYRTCLIADVVTGKLDVREVAARLPDEAEEPEPLDAADALSDANEDAADDLDPVSEENEL